MPRSRTSTGQLNGASGPLRVAVYCRQSVADDLEFGSLQAQREAVEAYVVSQRAKGWTVIPDEYNDHGFSGGNTNRPGLKKLLQDIEAGKVDAVAVNKLDRLSRSIADFVGLMSVFEKHEVAFVSTTQSFDTSTSLGRMTVNLLATFAAYERDLIGERTRDKIRATRMRGMWTGGTPPLGYRVEEKKLLVVESEAEQVRDIFKLYLRTGSLIAVAEELNRRGWKAKSQRHPDGREYDKNAVGRILGNPLYLGKIAYKDELYDGLHEAIVDQDTWDAVQHQLKENAQKRRKPPTFSKSGALLQGIARCGRCGAAMAPHFSARGNTRYGAYCCGTFQKRGAAACPGSRVPLRKLESFVIEKIMSIGRDPRVLARTATAARKALQARKPGLQKELRSLERLGKKQERERTNLLDAIAKGGRNAPSVLQRVATIDDGLIELSHREEAVRSELAAIRRDAIDEADLRAALESFEPIWSELFPREQARVLHLLVESVTFDSRDGSVEIAFRPGGVRAMAEDAKGETA